MGHRRGLSRVVGVACRTFPGAVPAGLGLWLLACAWLTGPARAHADDASGSWSFLAEGRGNAFVQRSSRAVVPELELDAQAPNGLRLSASYLVDVISSASVVQAGEHAGAVFTELRHGASAGAGQEIDLGGAQLDLAARGTLSVEDDYTSLLGELDFALALAQRTTTLSLSLSHLRDHVESNLDPSFDQSMRGVTGHASLERVINRWLVLTVGYQLAHLQGFLANPYRRALIGPLPYAETHPRQRLRHNATAHLALSIPHSNTALHLLYRAYVDSWDVAALSPEARVYQQLLDGKLVLQLRYRFYTQTAAYFFRRSYPVGWDGYISNDPKMAAFRTHVAGASADLSLGMLAGTVLDFARDAWLDLAISRYLSTSAYGDGWILTAGCRAAF